MRRTRRPVSYTHLDVYKRQPETLCLQAVEVPYVHNRVLFVERSGELRLLARLSTTGAEPKGNQVLRGREVSKSRPETG